MTATRTMLRTAAHDNQASSEVFARVNDLLHVDIPSGMFATCFYALLDPTTGYLRFANAGQDMPNARHADGSVSELHATGIPLGLMPSTHYDESDVTLMPGDCLLFYSDGLVEAHNPEREMFGLQRIVRIVEEHNDSTTLIDTLLGSLRDFTGSTWEQEDDVTLLMLRRNVDASDEQIAAPVTAKSLGGFTQ